MGVSVGYWGVGIGAGGQRRGLLTPGGTAPLSPAVQLSVGVWLSLPEHSAPPSLFPSFQHQQLSHSPRLIPGVPWHLCISSSLVSELYPGLAGTSFLPLLTWSSSSSSWSFSTPTLPAAQGPFLHLTQGKGISLQEALSLDMVTQWRANPCPVPPRYVPHCLP